MVYFYCVDIMEEEHVGIVPDDVAPKYCHGLFPKEDAIYDFINPWYDPELARAIEEKVDWYPVKPLERAEP